MGTGHLNVWLRGANCIPLTDCWRADLVVKTCNNEYLVNFYSEILKQLEDKYSKPGLVKSTTVFPVTDQNGLTLLVTIDGGTEQTVTLSAPAITVEQNADQIASQLNGCTVSIVEGQIEILSNTKGPSSSVYINTASSTSTLVWGAAIAGSGYSIKKLDNYQNATRISITPPAGEYINHIELDVPPGAYKVWCRCCHGKNEETNIAMVNLCCDDHKCVNLLLNAVQTCAENIVHPFIDHVVNDGQFQVEAEVVPMLKGFMYVAYKSKAALKQQIEQRLVEAQEKGDIYLEDRVQAVLDIVNGLPDCN